MARSNKARPGSIPAAELEAVVARIAALGVVELRAEWRRIFGASAPLGLSKDLLARTLAHRIQVNAHGSLQPGTLRLLRELARGGSETPRRVKVGSVIVREYAGVLHEVVVVPGGFVWQQRNYDSLSTIAKAITGTTWNGPRFFGLRSKREMPNAGPPLVTAAASGMPRVGRRSSVGGGAASESLLASSIGHHAVSTTDGIAGVAR